MILDKSQILRVVLTKINCSFKSGIPKCAPESRVHVQVLLVVCGLSVVDLSFDRKDGVRVRHDCWRHVEIMWPFPAFSFRISLVFLKYLNMLPFFSVTSSSRLLQDSDSETSHNTWFSSVATDFPATFSINPPRYASCSRAWALDAASSFEFLLALASGFPVDVLSFLGFLMQSNLLRMRNLSRQFKTGSLL